MAEKYLVASEDASAITVESFDGTDTSLWKIAFGKNNGGVLNEWYKNGGTTNYTTTAGMTNKVVYENSTPKQVWNCSAPVLSILEGVADGVTQLDRIIIKVTGELQDTVGYDYTQIYAVYPDIGVFETYTFTNNTGADIDTITSFTARCNVDNFVTYAGFADNNNLNPTYGIEYWWAMYDSDSGTPGCIMALLYASDSLAYPTRAFIETTIGYVAIIEDTETPIPNGASYTTSMLFHLTTDEITLAGFEADVAQYVAATAPTVNDGAEVTTGVDDFIHLGDGFWSDGCWHYAATALKYLKFTGDSLRYMPKIVIHNSTGSGIAAPNITKDSVLLTTTEYNLSDISDATNETLWLLSQFGDIVGA